MVVSLSKTFGRFLSNRREMPLGLAQSRLIYRENLTTCMSGITLNLE